MPATRCTRSASILADSPSKPVDPDNPAVADDIAKWKKTPGTVAVRIMMAEHDGRDPHGPALARIARAAARHNFPVNLHCWGNLAGAVALIDRHPETRFVIDHLGIAQPSAPPVPPQLWAELPMVLDLARRPNAAIKVSGVCTMSTQGFPFPDIWDQLARVFDAWGFERCLWGTDWTRAHAVVPYQPAVESFRITNRLSEGERAMLMGGACARIYGWTPKVTAARVAMHSN